MKDTVFVSYSRRDSAQVLPLVERLSSSTVRAWLDQSSIPVSVPWLDEITQALRGALVVLVCESTDWHSSPNCAVELEMAQSMGKPIVWADPHTEAAEDIVLRVKELLGQVSDKERLRSELLVRSYRWARGGRRRAELASGPRLRAYRELIGTPGAVDVDAVAFVRRSRSRARRQLVVAATAGLTTFSLIQAPNVFLKANDKVQEQFKTAVAILDAEQGSQQSQAYSGYLGLQAALDMTKNGEDNFSSRRALATALSTYLPSTIGATGQPTAAKVTPSGLRDGSALSSPDGTLRATVWQHPARVRVSTQAGAMTRTLATDGLVQALSWNPTGTLLAIADLSGVRLVDVQRASTRALLRGVEGEVTSMTWGKGSRRLQATTTRGLTVEWTLNEAATVTSDPGNWFMDLARNDSSGSMAAVTRQGRLVVIDAKGVAVTDEIATGNGVAVAVTASPQGWLVAYAGSEGSSIVLVRSDGQQQSFPLKDCSARDVVFSVRLAATVVACDAGGYGVLDVGTGSFRTYQGELMQTTVASERDGRLIIGGGAEEFVELLAPGREKLVRFGSRGCLNGAESIGLMPGGKQLFIGGAGFSRACAHRLTLQDDGTWKTDNVVPSTEVPVESRALAVSGDGSLVAYGFSDGRVWIIESQTLSPLLFAQATGSEIRGITFTKDDRALVAVTRDGEVLRFDVAQARQSIGQLRTTAQARLDLGIHWKLHRRTSPTGSAPTSG